MGNLEGLLQADALRFSSMRGLLLTWQNPLEAQAIFTEINRDIGWGVSVYSHDFHPHPTQEGWRSSARVLWATPNNYRMEISQDLKHPPRMILGSNGSIAWSYIPSSDEFRAWPKHLDPPELDEMIHPQWLLRDFLLEDRGQSDVDGRLGTRFYGSPNPDSDSAQALAGRYGIRGIIDSTKQVVLLVEWLTKSEEPFQSRTLTSIRFDEPINHRQFDPESTGFSFGA